MNIQSIFTVVGSDDGEVVGSDVGDDEGAVDGLVVGRELGSDVGDVVGDVDGNDVGDSCYNFLWSACVQYSLELRLKKFILRTSSDMNLSEVT